MFLDNAFGGVRKYFKATVIIQAVILGVIVVAVGKAWDKWGK